VRVAGSLGPRIDEFLESVLPAGDARPEIVLLHEMMREYPRRGGKKIRGQLLMLACGAHGGDLDDALPVAAALELFQNWVLIHDDIEDGSEERRGLPALHRLHGMPLALNAGDLLHALMWEVLVRSRALLGSERTHAVLGEFARLVRVTAEGQHMELYWIEHDRWDLSEEDYFEMCRRKAAWYTVSAPLRLGAIVAGHPPSPEFDSAGVDLGLAFQIRDDVLNLSGEWGVYGKEIAGDLWEGKRTLILIHLLANCARGERDEIVERLSVSRGTRTKDDVQRVQDLIARYGSAEYAQARAAALAESGTAGLAAALADLPGRDFSEAVMDILRSLSRRAS
jgi:geranylgeranyl diphosphate synthase, type II